MIRKTLFILIVSIIPILTFSQDRISKHKIYLNWKTEPGNSKAYKYNFDSLVIKTIDNLKTLGVDTFGIYSKHYDDYYIDKRYSPQCEVIHWITYIQWIKNGKTYHQKILKCCIFEPILIEKSVLIRYYINSIFSINKGMIMPIITGASMVKGEIIPWLLGIEPHTIKYTLFCNLNGKSKFIEFYQCELDSKENLFYIENQNSVIISWKKMIDNQIDEIEND
jgi:hypothetical protein